MNRSILNNFTPLNLQSCLSPPINPLSLLSMDMDAPNLLLMLRLQNNLQIQMLCNSIAHYSKLKEQASLQLIPKPQKESPIFTSMPASTFIPEYPILPTKKESTLHSIPPLRGIKKSLDSELNLQLKSRQSSFSATQSTQSELSDSSSEHGGPLESQNATQGNIFSFVPDDPNICLEVQIKHMIMFFVNSYGKLSEEKVQQERARYTNDKALCHVFDTLLIKYASTTKTKEEMVKYILRRAFKSFRKNIKRATQLDAKGVSSKLCEKYFNTSKEDLLSQGLEIQDDEDLLKLLLPFRKNSKNKTMNSSFISEIFANEEFKLDYEASYLKEFDQLAEKDNKEKIKRFTSFIEECVKKQSYDAIKKYKRIPWLKVWIENTKKVAFEISGQKAAEESPMKNKKLHD